MPDSSRRRVHVLGALAAMVFMSGLTVGMPAFGHSGGLDSAGCHAGSQPYHCHNGGGGSSGGGDSGDDDDGGSSGSSFYDPGPTAAEIAAAEQARAERAARTAAQSDLAAAIATETQRKNELAELERKHALAVEEVNRQREPHETLAEKVDRYHRKADDRREDLVADRKAATLRLAALETRNRNAQQEYRDSKAAGPFVAALFGGFLLLPLIRRLGALIIPWRWAWLVGGFLLSMVLVGAGMSLRSVVVGGILSALGGLMLSVVFMLPGLWWLRFRIPTPITVVLLGLSALMLIASAAMLLTASAPVAQPPASSDVAQAQEAEEDPKADEDAQANKLDAAADKLQPKLDDLYLKLADAEKQEKEAAQLVARAKSQAETATQERVAAETTLSNLQ